MLEYVRKFMDSYSIVATLQQYIVWRITLVVYNTDININSTNRSSVDNNNDKLVYSTVSGESVHSFLQEVLIVSSVRV